MPSIEGASLSEARSVPDSCWALKNASFLVAQDQRGVFSNSRSCAWAPDKRIKWKQQER